MFVIKCHQSRFFCLSAAITLGVFSVTAGGQSVVEHDFAFRASDGEDFNRFGASVDLYGNIVVAGAPFDDELGDISGAAYVFSIEPRAELHKLLASDGQEDWVAGESVAIYDNIIVVGAPGAESIDTPEGTSGAVYLFDATTGDELIKLNPPNPTTAGFTSEFGGSVAVSSEYVVVGEPGYLDRSVSTNNIIGNVQIFDIATGSHLFTLSPNAGTNAVRDFGYSVAIYGDIVVVGSPGSPENGLGSGAVYLFDATSGSELAKIVPSDGDSGDAFGQVVDIYDEYIAVGAWGDDDNGIASGSVYIFETSGNQIHKLFSDDNEAGDGFGSSLALENETLCVGACCDSDNGSGSGSSYIFDVITGEQLVKLLPGNTNSGDSVGTDVALHRGVVIAGAPYFDRFDDGGAAFLFSVDRDGDGLLDDWENNGIPYTDSNGVDQRFMLPGADPMHKDLYVEVDSMMGMSFDAGAQADVIAAFANAPNDFVDNPDGMDGITLHLLIDEFDLCVSTTPSCTVEFPNAFVEFDMVKEDHFGTVSEHGDSELLEAKRKAYRYCIFGHSYGTGSSSGLAERPGNDFMVTLGRWTVSGGTPDQQAGTFMHEFGHTLGLGHGGISEDDTVDHINYKPNYYSVMNYLWQTPDYSHNPTWRLDYSRSELDMLDESALDETAGIDGSDPQYVLVDVIHGFGTPASRMTKWVRTDGSNVDWNGDGISTDPTPVAVDVNHLRISLPSSPGQELFGRLDWSNLRYKLRGPMNFDDGVRQLDIEEELTEELQMSLVATQCGPADLNGDGELSYFDVTLFNTAYAAQDPVADYTRDGIFTFHDVSAFMVYYNAGCP